MGNQENDAIGLNRAIGQLLRQRRQDMGITQTALADYLGITFQQVQKYETGENRISAARLMMASKLLRAKVDYFTGEAWAVAGTELPGKEQFLLMAYRQLAPRQQKWVDAAAKYILDKNDWRKMFE